MTKIFLFSVFACGLCLLSACGGSSSPGCVNNCTPGSKSEFVFAASVDHVQSLKANGATGALGSPTATSGPNSASGIVADPSAKFLYVTDYSSDAVDIFSVNASTGALVSAGPPVPIGSGGNTGGGAVAMDPKGKFLFATDAIAFKVAKFRRK
jgi:DNA-binding beta-propeller fold protein YncE